MTPDLEQLKRVALAATEGPWKDAHVESAGSRREQFHVVTDGHRIAEVKCVTITISANQANAIFIAAWNPQTALALIARIEKLENYNAAEEYITSLESKLSRYKRAVELCQGTLAGEGITIVGLDAILEGKE